MMNDLLFPERLKELLETGGDKPVSQTELSKSLGITRQAISSYLNGSTQPTIDKLKLIAEYFDVSADYLLGLSDAKQAENADIVDYLGLSESTINEIYRVNEYSKEYDQDSLISEIDALDALISSVLSALGPFQELCTLLLTVERTRARSDEEVAELKNNATNLGFVVMDGCGTAIDFAKYELNKSISHAIAYAIAPYEEKFRSRMLANSKITRSNHKSLLNDDLDEVDIFDPEDTTNADDN